MKIRIISFGTFKNGDPYREIFEEYRKRIGWPVELIEMKNMSNFSSVDEQILRESEKLLSTIGTNNKNYRLIVLDERGENLTTADFARVCQNFIEDGGGIDFILGGSHGLSDSVRNRADLLLSFGKMVHPHKMIRIMLMEQIYRIYSISKNHPYHR
ncbi:MAG: 23S rRNA (pseudouridine(1915)-N(3))-methyltransferase RlmH [Rickettsiales bacterium]|jgi:23S rRNA (pseudouridine1915-N3)-methyltransferase|nr:23S rRNA (pseudouridine(1915)-N(3))-methyltransferase RlmH [Rickettsiales bacterium]